MISCYLLKTTQGYGQITKGIAKKIKTAQASHHKIAQKSLVYAQALFGKKIHCTEFAAWHNTSIKQFCNALSLLTLELFAHLLCRAPQNFFRFM